MRIGDARKLINETPVDRSLKQPLFCGLQILGQYDEDLHFSCRRDQILCADFAVTVERMSDAEVREMARFGWFEDEESWSLYER